MESGSSMTGDWWGVGEESASGDQSLGTPPRVFCASVDSARVAETLMQVLIRREIEKTATRSREIIRDAESASRKTIRDAESASRKIIRDAEVASPNREGEHTPCFMHVQKLTGVGGICA